MAAAEGQGDKGDDLKKQGTRYDQIYKCSVIIQIFNLTVQLFWNSDTRYMY